MALSPQVLRRLLPAWEQGDAQGNDSSEMPIDALVRRADSLRDQRDTAGAAAAYAEALALDPNRTGLLVQRGNMLKDSGRFAEAETAYRMVLLAQPGDADAHLQLGHALKLQGRRNAALVAYSRAAELDPASPAASVELAAMGEPSRQVATFDAQFRAGGTDALVAMSQTLLAMRSQLDEMIAALPDAAASTAYPVDL